MNESIKYPIISLCTGNESNFEQTIILPDGSRVPMTENNVRAIAQGLEDGSIPNVMIPIRQSAEDGYEHPIEPVEIADNRNDFMAIIAQNELEGESNTVCVYQANAVTGTVIDPVHMEYSENGHCPVVSATQNYNFISSQMNLVKAAELPRQTANTDESNPRSSSTEKERFNAAKAAERVMSTLLFVQSNNAVYVYQGTYYKLCDTLKLYKLIRDTLREETTRNGTSNYIKDIARFIQTDAKSVDFSNAGIENKVMFSNVVFDLDTQKLEHHSTNNLNTHAISVPFVPYNASNTLAFDKYICDLANRNPILIQRLWEALGLLLSNDIKAKRIVLLFGKGNTGKSVFGHIVRELIADDAVTSFTPQKLTDRFVGTSLVNSAVNICMDLPSVPIDASTAAILKNLSGGDTVSGEVKYMNSFNYVYQGQLLFGTNYPLKLTYLDQAFADRLLVIPCENPIQKHLQNKNLLENIRPELPMIASRAVRAFSRVRKNNYIFSGDDIYSVNAEDIYTKSSVNVTVNNGIAYSVECFADQMCEVTSDNNDCIPISELYAKYCVFCESKGLAAISNTNTFSKELHKALPGISNKKKRVTGPSVNIWYPLKIRTE